MALTRTPTTLPITDDEEECLRQYSFIWNEPTRLFHNVCSSEIEKLLRDTICGVSVSLQIKDFGDKKRGIVNAGKNVIPEGTICCVYPAHATTIAFGGFEKGQSNYIVQSIVPHEGLRMDQYIEYYYPTHIFSDKSGSVHSMIGISGLPDRYDVQKYRVGHLLNDSHTINERTGVEEYLKNAAAAGNVLFVHVGHLIVVGVATRDIASGEELLFNYGPDYWLNEEMRSNRNIERLIMQFNRHQIKKKKKAHKQTIDLQRKVHLLFMTFMAMRFIKTPTIAVVHLLKMKAYASSIFLFDAHIAKECYDTILNIIPKLAPEQQKSNKILALMRDVLANIGLYHSNWYEGACNVDWAKCMWYSQQALDIAQKYDELENNTRMIKKINIRIEKCKLNANE